MNAYFQERAARRHWLQRHTRCCFLFDSNSSTDQPVNTASGAGSTGLQKTGSVNLVSSGAIGVGQSGRYQEAGAVGGNQSLSDIGNSAISAGGDLTVTSNAGVDASLAALQTALTNTTSPAAIAPTAGADGDSIFTQLKNWLAGYGLNFTEVSLGLAAVALGVVFLFWKRRKK
jgi:hypothetical protein